MQSYDTPVVNSGSKFQRLAARRAGRGQSIEPPSVSSPPSSSTSTNSEQTVGTTVLRNNFISVDATSPVVTTTNRNTYPVNYVNVDGDNHLSSPLSSHPLGTTVLPLSTYTSSSSSSSSSFDNRPAPTSPLPPLPRPNPSSSVPTTVPKKTSISVDGDDDYDEENPNGNNSSSSNNNNTNNGTITGSTTSIALPSTSSSSLSLQNIASIGNAFGHLPPPPPPPPLPKNKSSKNLISAKKESINKLVSTPSSLIESNTSSLSTPFTFTQSTPLTSNNKESRLSGTSTTLAKTILFQNAIAIAAGTNNTDAPLNNNTVSLPSSDPSKTEIHVSVVSSPSSSLTSSVPPISNITNTTTTVPSTDTVNNIMRSTSFTRSRSNRFTGGASSSSSSSSATSSSPTNTGGGTDLGSELDILPHEDIKGYIPGNVQFRNEFRKTTVLPTDTISAPTFAPGSPLDLALTATIKKRKRRVHKPDTLKRLQQGTEEFLRRKAAKVLGKIIDKEHRQYHLSFGMMLGIYTSCSYGARMPLSSGAETISTHPVDNSNVSSSSTTATALPTASTDIPLTDIRLELDDFMKVRKLIFPPQGSPLTPPHRLPGTFKFKDYAPAVFYQLRERFNIDQQQYLKSLGGAYEYIEFASNSKSGSFFFYSHDGKFMIKTQSKSESKFLRRILAHYYQYVMMYPGTYITRFYGMHRIKMPHIRKKIHFVVMQSVFYGDDDIHEMYDLKGSTVGRSATEKEKSRGISKCVLKDNDLVSNSTKIRLGEERRKMFLAQLALDASFLEQMKIMDYSLLLGIHRKKLRNKVEAHALTQSPEHGALEPPIAEVDEEAIALAEEQEMSGNDVSASNSDNDNTNNGNVRVMDKYTGVRSTHNLSSNQGLPPTHIRNESITRTTMSNSTVDPMMSEAIEGEGRENRKNTTHSAMVSTLSSSSSSNHVHDQSRDIKYVSDDDTSATESATDDSDQDNERIRTATTNSTIVVGGEGGRSLPLSRSRLQKQESIMSIDSAAAAAASAASLAASARLAKVLQQQNVGSTGVTSVMETLTKIRDNQVRREQREDSFHGNHSSHGSRPTLYDDSLTALGSMIWSVNPQLKRFVDNAYANGNSILSPPGPSENGGGIVGKDNDGNDTDDIYYMGIIDILQQYDLRKMGETAFKSLLHPVGGISAVSPSFYAKRFVEFLEKHSE